ncbi:hypothetical protein F4553_007559 [Allocatelliglobosispora scoriae]|uniref:Uncharacterized protein n=1 Tax=Allocatelliglobosispora scoriae TaxID=643052 RepID=A0A841C2I3_9ACTN|nr:hypothetical protein [Allocatelliglobosispora scoriae]MBB5874125.1 hypothetical protein [Allocatelliglobosispora scoriae]
MSSRDRARARRGSVPGRAPIEKGRRDGSGPWQATVPFGPAGRLLASTLCVLVCLPGPVLLFFAATVGEITAGERWGLAAGGVFTTLVGVFWAVVIGRWERSARRDAERLNEVGVTAVAEIVAIAPAIVGDDNGIALSLRISGPGVEPFDAVSECMADPSLVVGARLAAVVDPADNLFAIVPG